MIRFLLTALAALGFVAASGDAIGADKPTLDQLRAACVDKQGLAIDYTVEHSRHLNRTNEGLLRACEFLADQLTKTEAPPPPPPPPPAQVRLIAERTVNLSRQHVADAVQHWCGERYNRSRSAVILNDSTWVSTYLGSGSTELMLCSWNQASGGHGAGWSYPVYSIEMTPAKAPVWPGVEISRLQLPANPSPSYLRMKVAIPAALPDDAYLVRVFAYDASGARVDLAGSAPENPVYLNRQGKAKDLPYTVTCSGNYDYVREGGPVHRCFLVPKELIAAVPAPVAPRKIVPFSTALPADQIYRQNVVVARKSNIYSPVLTKEGVTVTENRQPYFFNDVYSKYPALPRVDGPRGVCRVSMPTHIHGTMRTDGATHLYVLYGQGLVRLEPDGHCMTMLGYRHKSPTYWSDAAAGFNTELIGDWSAVPQPWGTRDAWGVAVVPASIALDHAAPPIAGEQPHVTGPRFLIADAFNDRLLDATFSPVDRKAPPKITVCQAFPGGDPWDVAIDANGIAYVSLRKQSIIARVDTKTCARLADLAANDTALQVTVSDNRVAHAPGDLPTRRAAKVLGPEGVSLTADGKSLTVCSFAQEAAWNYDLQTGARTFRAYPVFSASAKSHFCKIANSNGTFGPADALAVASWAESAEAGFGKPMIYLKPDAAGVVKTWAYHGYGVPAEGIGATESPLYGAAMGFGPGFMAAGSAQEGIEVYSQRLSTDKVVDLAAYSRGRAAYYAMGGRLRWGDEGYRFTLDPLPCNVVDVKDYLQANGHCR